MSLSSLKTHPNVEELELYFVLTDEIQGAIFTKDLIPNGSQIKVTNSNLDNYIERRISEIVDQYRMFVNELKAGLFSVRI